MSLRNTPWRRSLLCRLGIHKQKTRTSFFPSCNPLTATEYSVLVFCMRCPMILDSSTYTRDPKTGEYK